MPAISRLVIMWPAHILTTLCPIPIIYTMSYLLLRIETKGYMKMIWSPTLQLSDHLSSDHLKQQIQILIPFFHVQYLHMVCRCFLSSHQFLELAGPTEVVYNHSEPLST